MEEADNRDSSHRMYEKKAGYIKIFTEYFSSVFIAYLT